MAKKYRSFYSNFKYCAFLLEPNMPRPVSAKVASVSSKTDTIQKVPRAASAGTVRPPPSQLTTTNTHTNLYTSSQDQRSTLPPHSNAPVNRPQAAAHIIMSTDYQQAYKNTELSSQNSSQSSAVTAATAHKSHFESKVKPVSNNFMSKVPMKVPTSGQTNGIVYHVRATESNGYNNQNSGDVVSKDTANQQTLPERAKITSGKKVTVSNASVSQTSRTSKINIQQINNSTPTYANQNENSVPVYDENGMRIDRTPTDDEITWLWDKVRNCLTKEEDVISKNTVKATPINVTDQKSPPTVSTKIIDGASLGMPLLIHRSLNHSKKKNSGASLPIFPGFVFVVLILVTLV